jgi:dihydrofolate reductase
MSSKVRSQISVSLDGYVAGPDQTEDEPLGRGGERLHEWYFGRGGATEVDAEIGAQGLEGTGAYVMGRNMFGPIRGEWGDSDWRGWWGPEPPYHAPVYVLTHHAHQPIEMEGGTTFHFVTDGFEAALALAREAAGPDLDVQVAGGASAVNQALRVGALDELHLHYSPILLGGGERLFVDLAPTRFEIVETRVSPAATHVRYRVVR